ncbi:MAG TPA: hypothetical protein PLD27_00385 [bacterium]|nr:hypothetical protein [bacterium]HOL48236.1 hypothetical protein [bacterium]HPQ18142.1 hypothetical protein [bacterium]
MSDNNKYWFSILYTDNRHKSIELLNKANFLPLKNFKSEAFYIDKNGGYDLILAKLTQYYLADELFSSKKLQNKLDILFSEKKELNNYEKFIMWSKLESKMFNVVINYTKKFFLDYYNRSLINKEKFYTDMFDILSTIINEDFLNAVLQHRYFMAVKRSIFIDTETAVNDFIKSILDEFIWFKEINEDKDLIKILLSAKEYEEIKKYDFEKYYWYNDNIAVIKEEKQINKFLEEKKEDIIYEKYMPPKFIIALEEYDDMNKKNFIKIITLNIKELLEEQRKISQTLENLLGTEKIEEERITQEELNKLVEENKEKIRRK